MPKDAIEFIMLSDANQREIERDSDERYDWYARPYGRGHQIMRIEKRMVRISNLTGHLKEGWLPVVYHRSARSSQDITWQGC